MLAGGFEQIESAERIDLKIENGNVAGFVVGRLSGAVNDQLEAIGFEKLFERVAIANLIETRGFNSEIQAYTGELDGDRVDAVRAVGKNGARSIPVAAQSKPPASRR